MADAPTNDRLQALAARRAAHLSRRLWHWVHLLSFVVLTGFRLVARRRRPARAAGHAVEPLRVLPPPTLRPVEEAIAEVRRGAARSGGVAAFVVDRGAVPRGARR